MGDSTRVEVKQDAPGLGYVEVTIAAEPMGRKADILAKVYRECVLKGYLSADAFRTFRDQVCASDLLAEGLVPEIEVCGSGCHFRIQTFVGPTESFLSQSDFKGKLMELVNWSIVTEDEAGALEAQVAERFPDLPDETPPGFEIFDLKDGYVAVLNVRRRPGDLD